MIASYLDSTNLKSDSTYPDIVKLCNEAKFYKMAAVCVLPHRVKPARDLLNDSEVKVCTVIGFPLGAEVLAVKVFAARQALRDGAGELDLVINIGAVKDGDYDLVEEEVRAVLALKNEYAFILKVIVETALLSSNELIHLTALLSQVKCDFIKTSTGFADRGVSIEDIMVINAHKSKDLKIKASGGIKTRDFARQLLKLGVDRIGTSSAVSIIEETGEGED